MKHQEFKNSHYNDIYDQYLQFNQVKNYKTGGGKMYPKAVAEFLHFMEEHNINTLEFTSEQMIDYYNYLIQRPNKGNGNKGRAGGLADSTINHHLFAIRLLFDLILETKKAGSLPLLPKFHRGKREPKEVLTVDEIIYLYTLTKNNLEAALISTAYGCGLRRSEIQRLNIEDINFSTSILIVKKGKYGKRREVPMSKRVVEDLKDYLYNERADYLKYQTVEKAFFISTRGTRVSSSQLYRNFQRILSRSTTNIFREKQTTLHTLRHSIATHLVENGADIHFVKTFLGHSEIDTSHLYSIRRRRKSKLN